ncbi:hypothetical protein BS50DRAFT_638737 [Corynespora cassiicola Philippines]|uniref:Uncharacterized protein n=1 Tax=Corynespora cassiicola Philippines TaxID=1448308 RepID=A0A2T2N9N1_CORCC|nr:hypothetical protein BS50DRAFT_638737 [Corynespora cassiicola Philippines]
MAGWWVAATTPPLVKWARSHSSTTPARRATAAARNKVPPPAWGWGLHPAPTSTGLEPGRHIVDPPAPPTSTCGSVGVRPRRSGEVLGRLNRNTVNDTLLPPDDVA